MTKLLEDPLKIQERRKNMPKQRKKDAYIRVYLSQEEKKQIEKLTSLSGEESMSKFILEAALNIRPQDDSFHDLAILLTKHFKEEKSFQQQQQITMYMIMQFCLYLASFSKDRKEIMEFYEDIYEGAIEKFGKEEE